MAENRDTWKDNPGPTHAPSHTAVHPISMRFLVTAICRCRQFLNRSVYSHNHRAHSSSVSYSHNDQLYLI